MEHLGRGPLAQGLLGSLVYVLEFPFHIPLTCCSPHNPALTRMAFRIMLKTGLRVSEALALRRVDLHLDQDPPIIIIRADSPAHRPGDEGRGGPGRH